MSQPRFFCPPPLPASGTFELPRDAAHHAHRVLRLRVNDPVQIFDGAGRVLDGRIAEIKGQRVFVHELQACISETEPVLGITLAQAMVGSEKMDWVVQKATELGVVAIQPVQAQRSVARLNSERAEKRTAHWHSVTVSACEQCGRNSLPSINPPIDLAAWLASIRTAPATKLILHPEGAIPLQMQSPSDHNVILMVGPEGGFTEDEIKMAHFAGFSPIRLGKRILRTETAALAGIAAIQTLWGDFN